MRVLALLVKCEPQCNLSCLTPSTFTHWWPLLALIAWKRSRFCCIHDMHYRVMPMASANTWQWLCIVYWLHSVTAIPAAGVYKDATNCTRWFLHALQAQFPSLQVSDFNMGRIVGTGSFGRVCLAVHKQSGMPVAIKILSKAAVLLDNQVQGGLLHMLNTHYLQCDVCCWSTNLCLTSHISVTCSCGVEAANWMSPSNWMSLDHGVAFGHMS